MTNTILFRRAAALQAVGHDYAFLCVFPGRP